jgi:hypothetical protein
MTCSKIASSRCVVSALCCWVVVRIGCYTFRVQTQIQWSSLVYNGICGTNISVDISHLVQCTITCTDQTVKQHK